MGVNLGILTSPLLLFSLLFPFEVLAPFDSPLLIDDDLELFIATRFIEFLLSVMPESGGDEAESESC
jgi:hypothetical protein